MTTPTQTLLEQLIALPSVTPLDAGCFEVITKRLEPLGFVCERMDFGEGEAFTCNLWAKRPGARADAPLLVFAGHVDVVPPGPLERWTSPPFTPTVRDVAGEATLFGRGASDMKGSIAAFIVAVERFLSHQPQPDYAMAFLLTSDEEGPALHGTVKVCEALQARGEKLDMCIVGEPTSAQQTGDMIKNGRRGSMSGKLTVKGVQGHIAYPHLAKNPIHLLAPALADLVATEWDSGFESFPPTTWQVSNIHAGTGVGNVIPGTVVVDFNFRFCPASSIASLQERVCAILERHGLEYDLAWSISGEPFFTPANGKLVEAVRSACEDVTGLHPELSTSGGTSDGRFIAKICPQVIELGPPNASIHKIDEHIKLSDLEAITRVYEQVLVNLQTTTA
jgi:succinyl-diaminopimelate desuccinylase